MNLRRHAAAARCEESKPKGSPSIASAMGRSSSTGRSLTWRTCCNKSAFFRDRRLEHVFSAVRLHPAHWAQPYAMVDSTGFSPLRIPSRRSEVSSWPCLVVACITAASSRSSTSSPAIANVQLLSLGISRQSTIIRAIAVPPNSPGMAGLSVRPINPPSQRRVDPTRSLR
jgi:hypothetical protein